MYDLNEQKNASDVNIEDVKKSLNFVMNLMVSFEFYWSQVISASDIIGAKNSRYNVCTK